MKKESKFPEGFLWGAACSSYQVEGGIDNCNWSKDFPAGKACDFWNRYEEYFDVAEKLNQNVHRLSLEWSRIEPEEGKFNREAIEHYKKMLITLRKRGIKTMVTLWHFTSPIWFSEKGDWANFESPVYFQRFTAFVVKELNDYVDFWVTINEPGIFASHGYVIGKFPPRQKFKIISCARAFWNLARAHKKAYRAIKATDSKAQIGMAENYSFAEALYGDPLSRFIVRVWDFARNRMFFEYTKKEQDFIGVNYYFHERITWDVKYPFVNIKNVNKTVSDLGTEIYPRGIYKVLKNFQKYNLPVYITENGLADKDDQFRKDFIEQHLKWIHKAISEGVDVKCYLYWSLLDNFEWADGYEPRFGLVEMDYGNESYKIRSSALEYAKICKNNKLTIED
ncbi:MAG: family 1 glycosylhydrolase [Candidatus Paceibacterota bacterium]